MGRRDLALQILTIGLMINAACWPAYSLITAQADSVPDLDSARGLRRAGAMLAGALWYWQSILSVAYGITFWHCLNTAVYHRAAYRNRSASRQPRARIWPAIASRISGCRACRPPSVVAAEFQIGDLDRVGVGARCLPWSIWSRSIRSCRRRWRICLSRLRDSGVASRPNGRCC